jgi:hypothetical protein
MEGKQSANCFLTPVAFPPFTRPGWGLRIFGLSIFLVRRLAVYRVDRLCFFPYHRILLTEIAQESLKVVLLKIHAYVKFILLMSMWHITRIAGKILLAKGRKHRR